MSKICKHCEQRPRTVAYVRPGGTRQYRSLCYRCFNLKQQNKLPKKIPRYEKVGYKKKLECDLCHFKGVYSSQTRVWHVDGNINNVQLFNLRTICLNCEEVVKRRHDTWKIGSLEPDR